MPSGVMRWFDPRTGEGVVSSRRGDFAVRAEDVEPHARVPGARVQFDRVRTDGAEQAVRVRLRRGSRSSPRHRRFGDLKGAHHPEAKGHRPSMPAPPPREDHPVEVAQAWLRALRAGDLQAAAALYAPDAALHDADGTTAVGARAVQRWLQRTSGTAWDTAELHPGDGVIDVVWRARPTLAAAPGLRLRLAHGRIAELWEVRARAGA